MKDTLVIGGHEFQSRFILGSGKYSLDLINAAVQNAGAQIITLALRRANEGGTANILDYPRFCTRSVSWRYFCMMWMAKPPYSPSRYTFLMRPSSK